MDMQDEKSALTSDQTTNKQCLTGKQKTSQHHVRMDSDKTVQS